MTDKKIRNHDTIRDYDRWHAHMSHAESESPIDYPWYASVRNALGQLSAGRLLEIGCGRGQFAIWLAKQYPHLEIVGLDFSEVAISLARERATEEKIDVEFVQGDAQAIQFADESFDLVISCECMEHVPKPPEMAREIARVLKPGGRFVLTTENYLNGMLLAWLMSWIRREPFNSGSGIQPRENFFVFWMVRGYLRRANLVITQTEASHYQWLLLPRIAPSTLCTQQFSSLWARRLAKPFGRHFTFVGHKRAVQ